MTSSISRFQRMAFRCSSRVITIRVSWLMAQWESAGPPVERPGDRPPRWITHRGAVAERVVLKRRRECLTADRLQFRGRKPAAFVVIGRRAARLGHGSEPAAAERDRAGIV